MDSISFLAALRAIALMVREGDSPPPELGNTLASVSSRLRQRWLRHEASTTDVFGSVPMRQVPKTWVVLNPS